MKIEYQIIAHSEIDDELRATIAEKLGQQRKVKGDLTKKADRCKLLCIAKIDGAVVAVGGVKEATATDFEDGKAGLPELAREFEWELGYLFTEPNREGKGIGSAVVRLLIEAYGKGNLMASTEISANPGMVRILEKNGFRLFGKPWKSGIHSNYLACFYDLNESVGPVDLRFDSASIG